MDRFVPPSASRVVDYVAIMTVKLAPQLMAEVDQMSDIKHVRDRQTEGESAREAGSCREWFVGLAGSPTVASFVLCFVCFVVGDGSRCYVCLYVHSPMTFNWRFHRSVDVSTGPLVSPSVIPFEHVYHICLSVQPSVRPSVRPSFLVFVSALWSALPSIRWYFRRSVGMSVAQSIPICCCVSACPSVRPPLPCG